MELNEHVVPAQPWMYTANFTNNTALFRGSSLALPFKDRYDFTRNEEWINVLFAGLRASDAEIMAFPYFASIVLFTRHRRCKAMGLPMDLPRVGSIRMFYLMAVFFRACACSCACLIPIPYYIRFFLGGPTLDISQIAQFPSFSPSFTRLSFQHHHNWILLPHALLRAL